MLEHETYLRRHDDGQLNLPVAHKKINLLEGKLADAEREVEVKRVELNVLANKYNSLREDFSNQNSI